MTERGAMTRIAFLNIAYVIEKPVTWNRKRVTFPCVLKHPCPVPLNLMRLVHSFPYTIFSLVALCAHAEPAVSNGSVDPPGLQPIIAKANALLSSGQFTDATRAYTEAIDLSPTSYLLYFKRATAQLSLNRHDSALADFDKVLELTGGNFDKAYFSKGKIFAKEGNWAEAKKMLKSYSRKNIADRAAGDLLFSISEAEVASKKAQQAQRSGQWDICQDEATTALQTATHSTLLRSLRSNCALQAGDIDQVVADLTRLTHLTAPSTSALLTISSISYYLLPTSSQALATLKQCLHYDPDSNLCAPAHRQLKKFDKTFTQINNAVEASNWSEVIKLVTDFAPRFDVAMEKALKPESLSLEGGLPNSIVPKHKSVKRRELYQAICQAYFKTNLLKQSHSWCEEVLGMEGGEKDVDALKALGEGSLLKEDWETAVRYFERAFEASGRSNSDINQRLQKAHRLLKQSKKKDYYKVLGVPRDADARTIKKAYRKLAKNAHPDKGGTQAQMAALNEAYEVLSSEELRARFDNGDDPNDPTSGPGSHGNPFAQGGNPFVYFQQGGGSPYGGPIRFSFQH